MKRLNVERMRRYSRRVPPPQTVWTLSREEVVEATTWQEEWNRLFNAGRDAELDQLPKPPFAQWVDQVKEWCAHRGIPATFAHYWADTGEPIENRGMLIEPRGPIRTEWVTAP